jgi:hypothetical protein
MTDEPADVHVSLPSDPQLEPPTPMTAEQIRAKAGYREEVRNVPGVGPILMRTPTMAELSDMVDVPRDADGTINEFEATLHVLVLACPALKPEDVQWLRKASGMVVNAIGAELREFGLSPQEVDAAAATFRAPSRFAVRVDSGEGVGDDARPADA